ncbi:P116 family lipid acquisition surface protein [Malacoplasma penetrans]|uniref:P116 family lipid acquisition surface protein n=1 Tax=Malacoplasma penetrans TaxID=28227 RepID=UPI003A5C7B6C
MNNPQLKSLITGDLLGVTSSAKSLWQIVWDNFDFIISQVKGLANNNATLNSVLNLISIIFKKDATNGNFSSIYDSILANDTNKTNFTNALVGLLPSGVSEYIKILVSDNTDFNKENLLKIVTSISNTLNGLFEYADNATIDTPYYERYKNITFTRSWVKDVSVDTTNSPTTSFEYKVSFTFNSEVTLDLAVIKSLVNQTVFNSLVDKLTGINRDALVKLVEDEVSNVKFAGSKVNLVTPAATMIDNELANIKKYLLDYVPDSIKIGTSGNEFSLTYTADNDQIWFNPNKKGSNYYLGFSVGYDLNISYNDVGMVNSIVNKYAVGDVNYQSKYKVKWTVLTLEAIYFDYTLNYYNFWKPIIQNIFFKDYTYSSRFFLSDYSQEIATTNNYNENYYYTNLTFENKSNSVSIDDIKNLITKEDNNRNNSVNWNGTTENTNGINLTLSEDNKKQLFSKMFDVSSDNNNLTNSNFSSYYDFQFDSHLDFSTTLSFNLVARGHVKINYGFSKYTWDKEFQRVNLNVNLSASLYNSKIYFPINFYDSTNKKLVTSYTKNYTSFNVATTNS